MPVRLSRGTMCSSDTLDRRPDETTSSPPRIALPIQRRESTHPIDSGQKRAWLGFLAGQVALGSWDTERSLPLLDSDCCLYQ